jgi:catechol 2,3-dioxygenase-like lactoylglutathione lyase family enzyme
MSYVALATNNFDELANFYEELVGFSRTAFWDRANARGMRLTLRGLRLELLDNSRLKFPFPLGDPGGRIHLVVETDDLEGDRVAIRADMSDICQTSWGCATFELVDPDGVRLTFLQWNSEENAADD